MNWIRINGIAYNLAGYRKIEFELLETGFHAILFPISTDMKNEILTGDDALTLAYWIQGKFQHIPPPIDLTAVFRERAPLTALENDHER